MIGDAGEVVEQQGVEDVAALADVVEAISAKLGAAREVKVHQSATPLPS